MTRKLILAAAGLHALAALAPAADRGATAPPPEDPAIDPLKPADLSALDHDRENGPGGSLPDGYRWSTEEETGEGTAFIVQEATGRRVASTATDLRAVLELLGEQQAVAAAAQAKAAEAATAAEQAKAAQKLAEAKLAEAKVKARTKTPDPEPEPEPDDGLAPAQVAPGRSLRIKGEVYGPGTLVRLDPAEVSRLRKTGHLLAEDGFATPFAEGPITFNDLTGR